MVKKWWKESVVYQVYPRSFMDSNGDGIGDLEGIISKLDYLEELGIDVLWLSPIYKSPNVDNGYDISDYQEIMEEFGAMKDFDNLLENAHKRGLKVILDLVVNHTSDKHPWFVDSRSNKDGKYRDYYKWRKGDEDEPLNKWESYFGGSVWQYDGRTDSYYLHLFAKEQPDLNWDNQCVRNDVYQMMTWWLDKGIDGFRMDVINFISKAEGLPEGKTAVNSAYTIKEPFTVCGPNMHRYLKEMNERVLSKYDIMTVGETPFITVDEAVKITGHDENELNMIFQFEHMDVENNENGKWSDQRFELTKLKDILSKWQYGLNNAGWNSLYWNNHDQPRVVSRFGDDTRYWKESAKMLGTCLHMLKGTPYIYQGEEIGMTNVYLENIEGYKDIETINAYKEFTELGGLSKQAGLNRIHKRSRDNARTPMQWNGSEHAGFTTGKPWFEVNPNHLWINAESQVGDKDSIFQYYKKLIRLRKENEIIVYGDFKLLLPDSKELFVYIRTLNNQRLLVICNYSENSIDFKIPEDEDLIGEPKLLISNYIRDQYETDICLNPYEVLVYLFDGKVC